MQSRQPLRVVFTIAALLILCGFVAWQSRGFTPGQRVAATSIEKTPAASAQAAASEILSRAPATTTAQAPLPLPVTNRPPAKSPASTREQAANGRSIPEILAGTDMTDPEIRARVVAEIAQLEQRQKQAVLEKARRLGIPVRIEGPGRKLSILHDFRGEQPLYRNTLNKNAAISTAANLLAPAPYNLDGTGIKVGVWDGGMVRSTHVELTGRVTRKNSGSSSDDHGTHVAGTIAATGIQANAKGMAPKTTIDSYDWDSDYSEMTAAGAASAGDTARISLSNHSYGYGAFTADMGRYDIESRDTDAVTASLPFYLIFWAAGNEQDELTAKGGYQSVTFNALAKNVVTVGAVNDAVSGGVRATPAATIASFSSLGPCDDGRIKPDLVANGVSVYSTIATSNSAYDGTYSGTSMATPSAVGSAALLAQLYAREFSGLRLRASTLKALLIHTADDLGPAGPDYTFGWGLLNTRAAADLILDHKNSLTAPKIIDGQITNTQPTQSHTFVWDGLSPIRATLCWTDPAGDTQSAADSRIPNLKHNLDAKITAPDGTTIYQPFVMPFVGSWTTASMASAAIRGKNNVDNVEQVFLSAPTQPGTYTATVSLDGTLNPNTQAYSLIITGGTSIESNPPPTITLTSPANGTSYLPGTAVTLAATATDLAFGGGPGVVTQVEFFAGTTSLSIDTTAPFSLGWTPSASGTHILTAKATDNGGATATSAATTITVLTGNGVPVVSSFTPASGAGGSSVVLTGSNFIGIATVKFNGMDAAFTVDSPNQITAIVPALAASGAISVTSSYGTGTSATPFTVLRPPVLISQIYGAGGSSGAIFNRDYVELHNRSATTVSLAGWSLQYAAATGTTWLVTSLSGTIAPGKYHLVGLASGSNGASLPAPDTTHSTNISATSGKLALLNSTTTLSGSSPLGALGLQDFVGYGTANAYETTAAPAPSTTTAIFRAGSGAVDTGNNSADFTAAAPAPRNSASAAAPTFNTWIASYQVGGLTGFTDDPDHDGIPNGVENLLGTAPDSASPGLTQIAATATALTFQHTRSNSPAAGLTSSYQWSADLQSWHPSAASVGGLTAVIADTILIDRAAPLNDIIQVTATVTQGAAPQLHLRLKVTQP
jgi:hypothetical protein